MGFGVKCQCLALERGKGLELRALDLGRALWDTEYCPHRI